MVTFPIFPLCGGPEMIAKWANQFKNSVEETSATVDQNVADIDSLENTTTDIKAQNYIVVSSSETLAAERILAAEAGVVTLTDGGAGSNMTIGLATNGVTFGKIQQIATARFLGRTTAATGNVEELTGTQATALLDAATTSNFGLVKKIATIADLNQTITNPPTQAEVQAISDKIDELLAAARTAGVLNT